MKKKIILGLLVLVVFLCFIAQSWALDWKRAQQQYYEHPWQDVQRVSPVQPVGSSPSTIKFIFVPAGQNLPVLIFFQNPSTKAASTTADPSKMSTNSTTRTNAAK
jgi:hypothetical protein